MTRPLPQYPHNAMVFHALAGRILTLAGLTACFVASLALTPSAMAAPPPANAPDQAMPGWLKRLPAETLALVSFDGSATTGAAFQSTPLGKILADPASRRYLGEVVTPLLSKGRHLASQQMPAEIVTDLQTLALGVLTQARVSVAVCKVEVFGPNNMVPHAVIVFEPLAAQAQLEPALNRLLAQLEDLISQGPGGPPEVRMIGACQVKTKLVPNPQRNAPVPISWGRVGTAWMLAIGDTAESVAFHEGNTPPAALYNDPNFLKVGRTIGSGQFSGGPTSATSMMTFINMAAVVKLLGPQVPPEVLATLELSGVTAATALAESCRIQDGAFRTVSAATMDGPGGLLAAFPPAPLTEADLRLVPLEAPHFVSLSLDPATAFDVALKFAQAQLPREVAQQFLDIPREEFRESLGFDLRDDLLAALGSRVTLVGTPSDALPLVGGTTLVWSVRDLAKLQTALAKLRENLPQFLRDIGPLPVAPGVRVSPAFSRRPFANHTLDTLNLGLVAPAWVVAGDRFVLGLTPQAVCDYLAWQAQPARKTVLENPDFAARLAKLGGLAAGHDALIYSDMPRWWPHLHTAVLIALGTADLGLQSSDEFRLGDGPDAVVDLKPELFPGVAVAQRHLTGLLVSLTRRDNMLITDITSPVPLPPVRTLTVIGQLVGPIAALEALKQQRTAAQQAQAMNHLVQLAIAALNHAQERDDTLPRELTDLADYVGGRRQLDVLTKHPSAEVKILYLEEVRGRTLKSVGNDAPVMAFPPVSPGDPYLVAFGDGSVRAVSAAVFEQMRRDLKQRLDQPGQ